MSKTIVLIYKLPTLYEILHEINDLLNFELQSSLDELELNNIISNKKIIRKNMYWCNDINNSNYNKEITNRRIKSEKLFRKDNKYDCFILIKYNYKRPIKNRGSAIFLHLTKDYKKTAGCIAVDKKDFFIIAKILTKKSKIVI